MNVFVLCTGRCGSATFARACKGISNYSAGHETRHSIVGDGRWQYPKQHIEVDNRLGWMLGMLEKHYGDTAVYVHLIRTKVDTVNSYNRRWNHPGSLICHFTSGILNISHTLNAEQQLQSSEMLYEVVNENIRTFLSNKTKKLTIEMEKWEETFPDFWQLIQAEGNLESALLVLQQKTNTSEEYLAYRSAQTLYHQWKRRVSRLLLKLTGR